MKEGFAMEVDKSTNTASHSALLAFMGYIERFS
jgi:hypothetical protein